MSFITIQDMEVWLGTPTVTVGIYGAQVPQAIGMNLYVQAELGIPQICSNAPGMVWYGAGYNVAWLDTPNVACVTVLADTWQSANGLLATVTLAAPEVRGVYGVQAHGVGGWLDSDFITVTPSYQDGFVTVLGIHDVVWDGEQWSGDMPRTLDAGANVTVLADLTVGTLAVNGLSINGSVAVAEPSSLMLCGCLLLCSGSYLLRRLRCSLKSRAS